jgi:hypothetical protein
MSRHLDVYHSIDRGQTDKPETKREIALLPCNP